MIYVRKPEEQIFTPLHLIPPTVEGMIFAVRQMIKISF